MLRTAFRHLLARLNLESRVDGSCRRGFGVWLDEVDPGLVVLLWSLEVRLQRVEEVRRARAKAAAARAMARHRADREEQTRRATRRAA